MNTDRLFAAKNLLTSLAKFALRSKLRFSIGRCSGVSVFFFFFFFFYGELGIYVMEGRSRDGIRSGVSSIVNVTICPLQCFVSKRMNVLKTLAIENSF